MELEKQNFKINSKDWKIVNGVKQNPEGDVWEIKKGKFKGEQLFTWESAMRETKKVGKRMPTKEEWVEKYSVEIPDFPKVGYRDYSYGSLYLQGAFGLYWSSSVTGSNAFYLYFNSGGVYPAGSNSRAYGFSVRCVKEKEIPTENKAVTKLSTKYQISDGDNSIHVEVKEDGNLTIRTGSGNSNFKFENSNPETVRKIAELILKATKL